MQGEGGLDTPIDDLVESDYATVTPATRIHLLRNIFNDAKMVVVSRSGDAIVGVITKIDLIEYLAARSAMTRKQRATAAATQARSAPRRRRPLRDRSPSTPASAPSRSRAR